LEDFIVSNFNAEHDTEEFVECISHQFAKGEPTSNALGVTKKEMEKIVRHFLDCSPETPYLSAVLRERKSGKFVGCVGCEDSHAMSELGFVDICAKWAPSLSLTEGAYEFEDAHIVKNCQRGEMVHVFLAAIHDEFANKRLLYPLVHSAVVNAANLGTFPPPPPKFDLSFWLFDLMCFVAVRLQVFSFRTYPHRVQKVSRKTEF
jgi:hypothetical protein